VISVTKFNAAQAYNVIPDQVELAGSVRTLVPGRREFAEAKICAAARGVALGFGADVEFDYCRSTPVTVNHPEETDLAIKAARDLVGPASVDRGWVRKTSPICFKQDRALSFFSATDRQRACTTRHTTSMTISCLTASATG